MASNSSAGAGASATTNNNKVIVSISDNIVRLVLNEDQDDPVEYGADTSFADKEEIQAVTKPNGSPPNGVNMRALLRCNGGTLVFKQIEYEISVRIDDDHHHDMVAPPPKKAKTKAQQGGASGFTATSGRIPNGLGTTPYAQVSVLPSQVQSLFWDGTVGQEEDILQVRELLEYHRISGPMSLDVLHETGKQYNGYTVKEIFLDGIANSSVFKPVMTTERVFNDGVDPMQIEGTKRSLGRLGLDKGITKPTSFMDGYLHVNASVQPGIPTSVFEVKNDCTAPKEGNMEAVAHATNVAMGLVARGIDACAVVIPIFSGNGRLAQISAVYFLPGTTFPVVCFVTTVLDLFDDRGLDLAATALERMLRHRMCIENKIIELGGTGQAQVKMELDLSLYFTKSIRSFCPILGIARLSESVAHVFQLTSRLEGCSYCCRPLAYRLKDIKTYTAEDSEAILEDVIVFKRMDGYKIGLPADKAQRKAVMKHTVAKLHSEHKLVHLDVYMSNIMWKWNEEAKIYDVCLVDFDSVHQEGELLSPSVLQKLQAQGFEHLPSRATFEFDILYMSILETNLDTTELTYQEDQNAARSAMDSFFRVKLAEHLSDKPLLSWAH